MSRGGHLVLEWASATDGHRRPCALASKMSIRIVSGGKRTGGGDLGVVAVANYVPYGGGISADCRTDADLTTYERSADPTGPRPQCHPTAISFAVKI